MEEESELPMDEYEVEMIVNHRNRKGNIEYLVKWKGYDHFQNTWEPIENLVYSKELIDEYNRKSKTINSNKCDQTFSTWRQLRNNVRIHDQV